MINYKLLADCFDSIIVSQNPYSLVESDFIQTDDLDMQSTMAGLARAYKSALLRPFVKMYLLWYDESIREDVTDYLISGGTLSSTKENGVRRRASVSLRNDDGSWTPNPVAKLWKGTKFRLDIGVELRGSIFKKQAGIFVAEGFSIPSDPASSIVTLQLVDKFGSIDGTTGGKIGYSTKAPLSNGVENVISAFLKEERMVGVPFDPKPIMFPPNLMESKSTYSLSPADNTTRGDIIKSLADMVACIVYYSEYGNLAIEKNDEILALPDKQSVWEFSDKDSGYCGASSSVSFGEVYNVITVVGATTDGYLADYTAKNTNPQSNSNIYVTEANELRIEDTNLLSDAAVEARAKYELFKQSAICQAIDYKTSPIPHINAGDIVNVTNEKLGMKRARCLVVEVSYPLDDKQEMTMTLSDLRGLCIG